MWHSLLGLDFGASLCLSLVAPHLKALSDCTHLLWYLCLFGRGSSVLVLPSASSSASIPLPAVWLPRQCKSLKVECCASCRHVANCLAHTNMVPAPAAAFALAAAARCLTLRNVTSAFFPAASAASTAPVSASVPCQPVVPAWTSLLFTMAHLSVELPATRSARLCCAVPDVPKKVPVNRGCWCSLCSHTGHTCRQCRAALQRHTAIARSRRWAARWTAAARSVSVPWRRSRRNAASGTPS